MKTMTRNARLCVFTLGVACAALVCCTNAYADGTTIIVSDGSADSLNQIALKDTFDDNQRAPLWKELFEDPNNARVVEANKRLELRTSALATGGFAGFLSNAWRLDPRYDFAMKVDFHYDLFTLNEEGSIGIGLTPSPENLSSRRVELSVGCVENFRSYRYERVNGYSTLAGYFQRWENDGTLYVSYDSQNDVLYMSLGGYGPEQAWATFDGLLRGTWGGRPLYVYLGGRSTGLTVTAGRAYLDNIVVEAGKIIEASLKTVYRFWSPVNKAHFFTINESEKNNLVNEYSDVWKLEGTMLRAFPDTSDPNCLPVYRFWSDQTMSHLYTLSEKEAAKLINEQSFIWTYQGVAFYAYPPGKQPSWALPVYRFWSRSAAVHFYTPSETEVARLRQFPSDVWYYEGVAWYAVP